MWWTLTLNPINDIPRGTLVRITEVRKNQITIVDESTGKRVILHQPAWWGRDIGLTQIKETERS